MSSLVSLIGTYYSFTSKCSWPWHMLLICILLLTKHNSLPGFSLVQFFFFSPSRYYLCCSQHLNMSLIKMSCSGTWCSCWAPGIHPQSQSIRCAEHRLQEVPPRHLCACSCSLSPWQHSSSPADGRHSLRESKSSLLEEMCTVTQIAGSCPNTSWQGSSDWAWHLHDIQLSNYPGPKGVCGRPFPWERTCFPG